jgi:predicted dehydrogenase
MKAGANVVVEKPMATCLEECDRMLEAEKKNNVTMACIAQNRFRNSISKLKDILDSGKAGKLRVAHVNSLWWRGHSYYDLWWRGLWEKEGGGPTLNHAVHHIDMINWMQGTLPEEVTAVLANVMHDNSEVEDLSFAVLRYTDGSMAQVTSSVVHHGEEQGLVFQCEHAKIQAPWDTYASMSRPNGFPERNHGLEKDLNRTYKAIPDLKYEGHTGQIDNILTALERGNRPMITGIDGRNTVELISAIYMSGFRKQTVSLPIAKVDDCYTFQGILKNAVHFYKKGTSVDNFEAEDISVGNYDKPS